MTDAPQPGQPLTPDGVAMPKMFGEPIEADGFEARAIAAGHKLFLNEESEIDAFVCDVGTCNGPGCATCGWSACHHCDRPIPLCRPASPVESAEGEAVDDVIEAAWRELCERDDRTSPAEYPEMCLIEREELADFMRRVTTPVPPALPDSGDVWSSLRTSFPTWADKYAKAGRYEEASAIADAAARDMTNRLAALQPEPDLPAG